jgi:cysteinyl-tRNA synthetase
MHNGFVTVNGEKMSKSLGNISLVKDLAEDNHGEVIRLSLLSSHYRQALDWNDKVIHQAKKLLDKLYKLLADLKAVESSEINEFSQDFIAPLLDDLNTPGLLANLNKMINEFKTISDKDLPEFKSKLLLAADLIGICQEDYLDWFDNGKVDIDASKVDALILERLNAKKNKDFDKADAIRQQLLEMSIEIKDTESGTDWTVKV